MEETKVPPTGNNDPSTAENDRLGPPSGSDPSSLQPKPAESSSTKIEANRRNALKSTGPKARSGKERSRLNAWKSGFFAKQVVASSKVINEKVTEFQRLLRDLWLECEPVGRLEELLLEQIAICFWMLRRLLRHRLENRTFPGQPDCDPSNDKRPRYSGDCITL
jgi:hypothetical protein